MKVFIYYIKRNIGWIAATLLTLFAMCIIMELNGVAFSEWIYGGVICLFLVLVIGGIDFSRYYNRHRELIKMQKVIKISVDALSMPGDQIEEDYQTLLQLVHEDKVKAVNDLENRRKDLMEYYTMWVHQIKTPIAAMRLTLQGEDTPAARRLTAELGRIEQYVDMVLTYLRLEEGGSDYVIRPCSVDEVVRAAVRRFAGEFIDRRIRLDYEPVQWETVTDGKWLTFVVEQLLSNALKYTGQEGAIRIYRQGDELCIADTGIGIAPEDLPRVFQMGYTGQNGRLDRRSSGIGLYLCRRICGNLRHGIRMESVPGKGTTVYLTLGRGDFLPE